MLKLWHKIALIFKEMSEVEPYGLTAVASFVLKFHGAESHTKSLRL